MNDYKELAKLYSMVEYTGTGYLVYRDLPQLIKKYTSNTLNNLHALDYGCGTGDSTRILTMLGFNKVIGVDIDERMLNIATLKDNIATFQLINKSNLNLSDDSIDLVLSCLVMMEVPTIDEMNKIFAEIFRILKPDGVFILVVSNENLYKHDWLTINTNFPENQNLKSGNVVRIDLTDINLTIYDYFWSEEDYLNVISSSNFALIDKVCTLGTDYDGYTWVSEDKYAPFTTYIVKKNYNL